MCIIVLKPEKVILTRDQLRVMWDTNPHGAGFMYANGGKVHVVKGLMTLDALENAMEQAGPLRKMALHFRIRTHGPISPEMTHPFWVVENKLALVHNGVIRPLVHKTTDKISDTAVFAKTLAENYTDPLLAVKKQFHREMLEAYIGYSKVVFMDGKGRTWILNEHLGEWHQNIWYSNSSYKVPTSSFTNMSKQIKDMPMDEFEALLTRYKRLFPNTAPAPRNAVPPVPKASLVIKNQFPEHFEPIPPEARGTPAPKNRKRTD